MATDFINMRSADLSGKSKVCVRLSEADDLRQHQSTDRGPIIRQAPKTEAAAILNPAI